MEEHTILCVDDEESILNSLKRLLRKEPYKIYTATGGEAGLAVMAEHPVQLVITDQRMPGMTGTEFLQKVKESWPDTTRIILSGYAEVGTIVNSINQGEIYRFIAKPWQEEELKAVIRQGLERYDMIQENIRLSALNNQQLEQLKNLNNLLEASVEVRTKSLQLSQEILEKVPLMIMGISYEEELILTNSTARTNLEPLGEILPGTEIEEILPADAVAAIRACLTSTRVEDFTFQWAGHKLKAVPKLLGDGDGTRGCVLLLQEVVS